MTWNKKNVFKEINIKNTPEKVSRHLLKQPISQGGLNMIDMIDFQRALAFKWIILLSNKGNGAWRILPTRFLNSFDKNMFAEQCRRISICYRFISFLVV